MVIGIFILKIQNGNVFLNYTLSRSVLGPETFISDHLEGDKLLAKYFYLRGVWSQT